MEEKKLQDCLLPDPARVHPIEGLRELIYVKPTIKNPNVSVGDFTYFGDEDFEKHVTHFYPFYGDKLIIGNGAIIGMNSVVGSDVPPYTIVAGNPARTIRKRFDDELIDLLQKFEWWNLSIEEINALIPVLSCSDLEKTKKELRKRLKI